MINQTKNLQTKNTPIPQQLETPTIQPEPPEKQTQQEIQELQDDTPLSPRNEIYIQHETPKLPNPELEQETPKLPNPEPEIVTPTLHEPTLTSIEKRITS